MWKALWITNYVELVEKKSNTILPRLYQYVLSTQYYKVYYHIPNKKIVAIGDLLKDLSFYDEKTMREMMNHIKEFGIENGYLT